MPGSYEVCPVYFWEDGGVQFRWPAMSGGANKVSVCPPADRGRATRPRLAPHQPDA
ncbi:CPCC family cysteine-rich protein [Streptomyces sp. NPDC048511]|uniref:CPCC family cysteine-rich protein n=1 Tax=Streptomyces sp. NPDC048511 TaxID=3365562 RepID=UPI00371FCA77